MDDSGEILATRKFAEKDQIAFAAFSGDVNPIHMDEIEARKLISGQRVVHGIHGMLWGLDCLALSKTMSAASFQCKFIKPIFLDEEVLCIWFDSKNELVLSVSGIVCSKLTILSSEKIVPVNCVVASIESKQQPSTPSVSDFVKDRKIPLLIYGQPILDKQICPSLSLIFGNQIVCEIASLSTFVGMEMPGLYSMLSSLKIEIVSQIDGAPEWTIGQYDKRFNRLQLSVNTSNILGTVDAFHFPQSQEGKSNTGVDKLDLKNNEFAHVNALVIGGSRGLGNAVARLLCSGGGKVTITYNNGKKEAVKFQDEMLSLGLQCDVMRLSVGKELSTELLGMNFNQVYYFASPKIFDRKTSNFDHQQYARFHDFYVSYFEQICNMLAEIGARVNVFYPSSVAADRVTPGMEEYGKAKLMGETLCEKINLEGVLTVMYPRLPRLDTDQTQSIVPIKSQDPFSYLLSHVRDMSL